MPPFNEAINFIMLLDLRAIPAKTNSQPNSWHLAKDIFYVMNVHASPSKINRRKQNLTKVKKL